MKYGAYKHLNKKDDILYTILYDFEERQGDTMKILEELWLGNINPQRCGDPQDPRTKQALSLVVKNEDTMRAMLSEAQKEQLEKLSDCQSDLTDLLERKAFSEGFRLAVRLMADAMNPVELPSAEG